MTVTWQYHLRAESTGRRRRVHEEDRYTEAGRNSWTVAREGTLCVADNSDGPSRQRAEFHDESKFGYRETSGLIGGLSATTRRRAVACKQVSKCEQM
jgi:hypothetical protein